MEAVSLFVIAFLIWWTLEVFSPKKKEEEKKTPEQELLEAIAKYEKNKDRDKKKTEIVFKVNDD